MKKMIVLIFVYVSCKIATTVSDHEIFRFVYVNENILQKFFNRVDLACTGGMLAA
jgi:hypothetical protein